MSGKGSRPRPFSVSQEEYEKRWDAIFGRDLENETVNEYEDEALKDAFKQSKLQQEINSKNK
jgi:hypothetical protein